MDEGAVSRSPDGPSRARLHQRVARRVLAVALASVALVTLAVVPVAVYSSLQTVEQAARLQAAQFIRSLEAASMPRQSADTLADNWIALNRDLARVEIVESDGEVLVRRSRSEDRDSLGDQSPPVLSSGWSGPPWRPSFQTFSVVPPGGLAAGLVVVVEVRPDRMMRQFALGAVLLAVLLAGIVWWAGLLARRLADRIVRDVDRVRDAVSRIREGQLDQRVDLDSNDEIQELAEAVNDMAETLADTIERLREANQELESLDQTKADMVANVSHELKTPLTALRGYFELFRDEILGSVSSEARQAVEICEKNIDRLSLRIEELVQLARLERDVGRQMVVGSVSLERILDSVAETLKPQADDNGVSCTVNIATDLSSIEGNAEQLERVFANLVHNAVKFTPEGGLVRVVAEPHERGGRRGVMVRVADTGVGIPERALLRIFDRFYQVDPSTRRRYGGMGLGLAVVQSIVQSHRGSVWVESQEGRGSTFFVWLPREASDSTSGNHPVISRSPAE